MVQYTGIMSVCVIAAIIAMDLLFIIRRTFERMDCRGSKPGLIQSGCQCRALNKNTGWVLPTIEAPRLTSPTTTDRKQRLTHGGITVTVPESDTEFQTRRVMTAVIDVTPVPSVRL
ncbi:hypothetical protein QBC40DRAFT_293780 [Triangularia verruculosa]|uniref:Uncharacterized protein n=1 Tax=Triangularia verruculosa TaxID=2587418 RepID=A0AAN7AZX7_9PEZI|nr:hypothetical protein QBC40DRAFT_293780 [Triangularia verruculosa]